MSAGRWAYGSFIYCAGADGSIFQPAPVLRDPQTTIRHARGHRPASGAIEAVLLSSAIRWMARRRQADTVKEKGIGKIAIA